MDEMTIKDLYILCKKEMDKGNGDKKILLSDDEEGNGFHEVCYGFTSIKAYFGGEKIDDNTLGFYGFPKGTKDGTHIILG